MREGAAAPRRWVGTGQSRVEDAHRAGAQATADALAGEDARLLLVFVDEAADLGSIVEGCRAAAPGVPLIGCSTAGEIGSDGPGDASVVVMAFGGAGFSVATGAGTIDAHGDLRGAAAAAASCATGIVGEHQVLLLLSDGLSGDQQEVVRGAYGVVGAGVPLVGGCAGDGLRMRRTFQLHDDAVLQQAVVAAAIGSDAPLGIGVHHGWRRVGDPMVITEVDGTRVLTIDNEPALDVYLRRLGAPADVLETPERFTQFASTHPLGIRRHRGEEVRFVSGGDPADRSLMCIAQVPQGGLAWIMEGDDRSVLDATEAACDEALAALGGDDPLGVVAFDCIARRGVLGEGGIRQEVDRILGRTGRVPLAGFYTYGEIARTSGVTGFHNQTLVLLAVG